MAKLLLGCLKCCFWCLEKFLKFLNRNAYIMVREAGRWGLFLLPLEEGFALLRAECPPLPPSAPLCPPPPPSAPQIAVYGTNFCTSARNAFSLLMRNIIR